MEDQDRDFESFLGEFRLRQHGPFPGEAAVETVRRPRRWMLAVAAVAVAGISSILIVRNLTPNTVVAAVVEAAGDSSYTRGQAVESGVAIRSGGFDLLRLRLVDGTRIEMRAQSELSLESAEDGVRVRLKDGSIVVTAAKQHGHFYVETEDTLVSVVGTVFFVERASLGTRVGVCEGVVEVRQGLKLHKILPGQQTSTNSGMQSSIGEAVGWSSSAAQFAAAFPPPAIAVSTGPAPVRPRTQTAGAAQQPPSQPQPEPAPAPQPVPPNTPSNDAGASSPGKQILDRACGSCHVVGIVEKARYPNRESYEALIARQVSMGAGLTPAEVPVLVDYLFNTYGVRRSGRGK